MLKRTLLLAPDAGEGNGNSKGADQNDILAQNEKLTQDITKARSELTSSQAQVTRLTGENQTLTSQLAEARNGNKTLTETLSARTQERDQLKAENEKLQASQKDFDAKLSAELVKHGIRKEALAQPDNGNVKLTLTQQCIAAKGGGTK